MKLTKFIRDRITSQIKDELLSQEMRESIEKEIGKGLRKLVESDMEKGWEKYKKHIYVRSSIYVKYAPGSCSKYYACDEYPTHGVRDMLEFKKLPENLQNKIKAYANILQQVGDKISEVEKILLSCNTVRQLFEIVPEFEKYIQTEKIVTLPVPIEMINHVKATLEYVSQNKTIKRKQVTEK